MAFSPNAETVFADGPFGSPLQPAKSEIRALLAQYEAIMNAFTSNGGLIYSTLAFLEANLNYPRNTMAWVIADPVVANNGIYRKLLDSGTGSWTRMADLPFSFIIASDVGAGTTNAIQATTSIPVSSSALIWMNIFEANTASPVTVSFNGGSALTIKTNAGNNVAVGGLTAGMIVMGVVAGSTFRLVSDQASAAVVAAAEEAQAAAEAAAAAALAAANAGFVFDTEAAFEAANIPLVLQFVETAGYHSAGDGGAHRKKRIATPGSPQAWHKQSADGAWWELSEPEPNDVMFGSIRNGVTDDASALQALLNYAEQGPKRAKLLGGTRVCSQLQIGDGVELFGGFAAVLKAKDGLNSELLINKDGTNGNSGIDIHHIIIDGSKATQAASIKDLVRLNKCSDSKVHDCFLYDGIWAHINVNASTRVHVYNNFIRDGNGHGVVLRTGSSNCRVYDNDIFNIGPADGVDNGSGTTVFAYGILLFDDACQDNWIAFNRINSPNGHGIYFGGFVGDENYNYNKVFKNVIVDAGMRNTAKSHNGIWIAHGIGNEIEGNTVRGSGVDGLKLNSEANRNIVRRNFVSASGRHGIVLDDANDNDIERNHCFNNGQLATGHGIAIGVFGASQKYNDVRGNRCYDNQGTPTQSYGINEVSSSNSSDYNRIAGNRCYGNSQSNQMFTAGEHTKTNGNILRNSSGTFLETITVTGTQTLPITAKNVLINISGASRTLTLPTAANVPDDYEVLLVDIGGNLASFNAIINPSSGFTINGTTSFTMNVNNQRVRVMKIPGEMRFVTF